MTDRQLPELTYTGDPTHGLRLPELRVANATLSRTLGRGIDCLTEISMDGEHKWDAMAHVAWVIAKRTEPETPLGIFTGATAKELADALAYRPPADQPEPDPDAPTPSLDQLEEEAKAEGPTGTPG
jgi:hypothetical protein